MAQRGATQKRKGVRKSLSLVSLRWMRRGLALRACVLRRDVRAL